ncbi:hypothetical protein QJS10_CPA09g01760 [Acorus calamus]|uniref:Kinesin light chain n=1 Tax=Acorus calamus TaxID=4465 RepID=A0AAV9E833_ACOCL|nr:hypothetical protein QJS10_CPA09g01760 [Acorus calamus]
MRRAASSSLNRLLSNLTKAIPISQNTPRTLHPQPPPPLITPTTLPQFPKPSSSRTLTTLTTTAVTDSQPNPQVISQSHDAFESATQTEDILSAFKQMESTLSEDDDRLGLACLKVGQYLDSIAFPDHDRTLSFASRALSILDRPGRDQDITVAMALHLMGSVAYNAKRFHDGLGYLNRANRILTKLEQSGTDVDDDVEFDPRAVAHAVQLQLANTKTAMGRREEALVNLRRCLELKEMILDPGSGELGDAYRDLAEAYAAVLNFKEALPLCLKALETHETDLGPDSVEVAHDRRLLGVIYLGLEEHQKALEQNVLSQRALKELGMSSDLVDAEIDAANIHIALGKHEEAIDTLRGVVNRTDVDGMTRATVYMVMAKALAHQEKTLELKRCLDNACRILDKEESARPEKIAEAYTEAAPLYESVNEFKTALSLWKRAAAIYEKCPEEQHAEGNVVARIGWLLLLTGKVEEAVTYLESAAERLAECFGPKHFAVGYIYNNLGAAYLELDRPQSAVQMFELAKDILDVSLGPNHVDSIEACQSLVNAYNAMESYDLALEFQQQVVDAWKGHGESAEDELREAQRLLKEIKRKVQGSSSLLDVVP